MTGITTNATTGTSTMEEVADRIADTLRATDHPYALDWTDDGTDEGRSVEATVLDRGIRFIVTPSTTDGRGLDMAVARGRTKPYTSLADAPLRNVTSGITLLLADEDNTAALEAAPARLAGTYLPTAPPQVAEAVYRFAYRMSTNGAHAVLGITGEGPEVREIIVLDIDANYAQAAALVNAVLASVASGGTLVDEEYPIMTGKE